MVSSICSRPIHILRVKAETGNSDVMHSNLTLNGSIKDMSL